MGARRTAFTSFVFEGNLHFHTAMDQAEATSTYVGKGTAAPQNLHDARMALGPGTGYWCSKGHHRVGDTVTWHGLLHRRHPVTSIKINWAYAPGEVRVRTTPDGIHWAEAVPWHRPTWGEVSFDENMDFDRQRNVAEIAVDMRSPMPWGYFGINQATLTL
eukprot:NODE_5195_length_603_cov_423.618613.p2 GENE.NODE_5195_length_603_cov_423.618613~~NODE_5195_length_603_cov_423.618613.p2  ORF type:complete len:160 (+),score=45.38 NODE_5195_length_603_cov_423.618613:3-482(+)